MIVQLFFFPFLSQKTPPPPLVQVRTVNIPIFIFKSWLLHMDVLQISCELEAPRW